MKHQYQSFTRFGHQFQSLKRQVYAVWTSVSFPLCQRSCLIWRIMAKNDKYLCRDFFVGFNFWSKLSFQIPEFRVHWWSPACNSVQLPWQHEILLYLTLKVRYSKYLIPQTKYRGRITATRDINTILWLEILNLRYNITFNSPVNNKSTEPRSVLFTGCTATKC